LLRAPEIEFFFPTIFTSWPTLLLHRSFCISTPFSPSGVVSWKLFPHFYWANINMTRHFSRLVLYIGGYSSPSQMAQFTAVPASSLPIAHVSVNKR
jgi:hypothetical protein